MEDQDTPPPALTIDPVFGTIYRDGEFVQRGSVLGLAVDARRVVIAPVSGWVRVEPELDGAQGITVEIHPHPQTVSSALPRG